MQLMYLDLAMFKMNLLQLGIFYWCDGNQATAIVCIMCSKIVTSQLRSCDQIECNCCLVRVSLKDWIEQIKAHKCFKSVPIVYQPY